MTAEPEIRLRILIEATRLFAERGYGATSVREVAEAVGVSKPTLYYYFSSKERLFEEIVAWHLGRVSEVLDAALAAGPTLYDQLERLLHGVASEAAARPDLVRFLLSSHHRPDPAQPQVDVMVLHMSKVKPLFFAFESARARGELRADLPTAELVMTFVALMNAHLMAAVRTQSPAISASTLLSVFFHGASAPQGGTP